MKTIVIIISVILLIVVSLLVGRGASGAGDVQESSNVGRFQLFQGMYTALDAKNNRVEKETGIFLLDTSTGKVKRYMTGLDKDGKFFGHWVATDVNSTNK